jgi:hypothetical protein
MSGTITRRVGTWTQLLSTELNSLASGSAALQATGTNGAFDNTATGNLFFAADFELVATFGTGPTTGTIDVYLLPLGSDGASYADGAGGSSPVTSNAEYLCSFPVRAVTTAQRLVLSDVPIPGGQFVVELLNNGTGQALAASGSTLKMRGQGESYS